MSLYSPTNTFARQPAPVEPPAFGLPLEPPAVTDWRQPRRDYTSINRQYEEGKPADAQSRIATYNALLQSGEVGVNLELQHQNSQYNRLYQYLGALLGNPSSGADKLETLTGIVGAQKAAELLRADPLRKRDAALSAIVSVEYGDDKTFYREPYVAELMTLTGARNEEELINKYTENGARIQKQRQLETDARQQFLQAFAANGSADAVIASLGNPELRETARTLVKQNGRQAALEAAYNAIAPYARELSESDRRTLGNLPDNPFTGHEVNTYFNLAASIARLKDYDKIAAALELAPFMLPKDTNTWLWQSLEDLNTGIVSGASVAFFGNTRRPLIELADQVRKIRQDSRDDPDSWLGKGIRSTIYQVPRIAVVSATGIAATAAGGPTAGYASAAAMGSLVYGAESVSSSYNSGAGKWSAIGYGTSIGALEGAADMLAVGAGALVRRGAVSVLGGSVAGRAALSASSGRAGSILAGTATEFTAETIADPLGIAAENTYRMLGANLPVQNTFRNWMENYDPTDPEFIVPILFLGGGLGGLGSQATDIIHNRTLRSPLVLEALSLPPEIADMPDGPRREDAIREGMARSAINPERLSEAMSPLFAMTADNLDMLRAAIEIPGFEPLGDGTVKITARNGDEQIVSEELASVTLQNYIETEQSEAFITVYNKLAQKHVAEIARQEGIEYNIRENLDHLMALGKNKAEARAMAAIAADPELSEQYRSKQITLDEVIEQLEIVALTDQSRIDVANGQADILQLVEEITHARYDFDLQTGKITENFITDNLRRLQQYADIDLGDLSDVTQNREAIARIAKAAATNPSLLSNLPPAMESFVKWSEGHVAEVGRIIQEGELMSQAARDGIIDSDFVTYIESVADISRARDNAIRADLTEQITGETPLPAVRRRRRQPPRIEGQNLQTLEDMIQSAMSNRPERTTRAIMKTIERINNASTDSQSIRARASLLRLLDNSIDLKRYGLARTTITNALAAATSERLNTTLDTALTELHVAMYLSERDIAASNARAKARKRAETIDRRQRQYLKRERQERRTRYTNLWNRLLAREKQAKQRKNRQEAQRIRQRAERVKRRQKQWEKNQERQNRDRYQKLWQQLLKGQRLEEQRSREQLARDIQNTRRLARRQSANANRRSQAGDAESRRQIILAYELMEASPDELMEIRASLENQYQELYQQENRTDDTIELLNDIEYRVSMIDTFGSALYRRKLDNQGSKAGKDEPGRYYHVKPVEYINNAIEALRQLDEEGRIRWQSQRNIQEQTNKQIIEEAIAKTKDFHQLTPIQQEELRRLEREKAENNRAGKWLASVPSTAQYAQVLRDNGYEQLGAYIEKAAIKSGYYEAEGRALRKAYMTSTLREVAEVAGYRSRLRGPDAYLRNLVERNINFAGAAHSKGQLVDIYMKSLNPESRRILIDNNGYTAEQLDSAAELIGEDGLLLARRLFEWYRSEGARIAEVAEAYTGHPVFFDAYYTPLEVRNEKAGITENMGLGYTGVRVGKPKHLIDRVSHGHRIEIRDNPFTSANAYGEIMTGWMGNIELIELANGVFTNRAFADSLRHDLGHNTYAAIRNNILADVSAGADRAQRTAMAEIVGKVMSARTFAFLGGNLMSAFKSALSYFKPILMSDISAAELARGRALIASGQNELSFQDILQLDAIKSRRIESSMDRTVYDMMTNAPRTGIAIADYLANLSMSGISVFDLYGIQRSTYWAAAALQARGLTGDALRQAVNATVQKASQPETSVTRSGLSKHASRNEAVFYQFMSEQINTFGQIISNWKGKNKSLALQNMIALAVTEGIASIILQNLLGREEDQIDLDAKSLANTFLLAPITSLPIVGGVASIIASEAFGVQNYSYQRSIYDMDQAYSRITRTLEMINDEKDYTSREWVEHIAGSTRTIGLAGMSLSSTFNWNRLNSILKAAAVSANAVRSIYRPVGRLLVSEEIDRLKTEAADRRDQIKTLERELGKDSIEARYARRELNRINKTIRKLRTAPAQ